MTKLSLELKEDISELKDSIGEVLVTITPEMCRAMLSVRRCLQPYVQSGGQCFENLCKSRIYDLDREGHKLAKAAPFRKEQVGVPPA